MLRWRPLHRVFACALLGLATTTIQFQATAASTGLQYNHDVRPIPLKIVSPVTGPIPAALAQSQPVRLDHFNDAIAPRKDNTFAIVPGKPGASELIRRINATDPDDIMPPAKIHKTLTTQQKQLLARWIARRREISLTALVADSTGRALSLAQSP